MRRDQREYGQGYIQGGHRNFDGKWPHRALAAILAMGCAIAGVMAAGSSTAALAQEGAAEAELPPVEVVTTAPKQKKYPTPKVFKKRSSSAKAAASQPAQAPPTPSGAETADGEAAPAGSEAAIPGVAVVGGVVGTGDRASLLELEGSGHVITGEQLYTSHVFTTNEALRSVPGVHVRDEEGFGIRPNIAIRGLNPTRSTKTLLLEDGLFLTYAPYGANESYFHPSSDRFERIEVIKGTDLLLYGPQTISGAINYVTPNPPREPAGFASLTGGNRDYKNAQIFYGGWSGNVGGLVDLVVKSGNGSRDNTEHEIIDGGVKGIYQATPDSAFIAKASYFNEVSKVSYTGITDAEARNFGLEYNPFPNDRFNTERIGTSLTHNWDITGDISLASSVYYNSFDRDWWRQSSRTTDGQCGAAFRNARLAGQRVDPDVQCDSIEGRLREYYLYGFEQRATFDTALSDFVNTELKVGYRLHQENQRRFQINRRPISGAPDVLAEDNEREASAASFFVQDRIDIGPFSVAPIARYEAIRYDRTNNLFSATTCPNPPCQGEAAIYEFIPGVSVGFVPMKGLNFFAGVHEGFAPPRVEDAIGNDGGSVEVASEESVNIEAGVRSELIPGLKVDATYFRNDFKNLVAVGSIAAGNLPLAQGEALFEGAELFARLDSAQLLKTPFNIYGQVAWTYLWDAEQLTPFFAVDTGLPLQGDTTGNRQPYAPEHLVTARLGYAQKNFDAHIEMVYVGAQFADFLNLERGTDHPDGPGSQNALSGQFGEIDSYTIFNVGMTYTIESTNTDLFFAAKNVFDHEYIVDRTRGILPGTPQLFHVGLKQNF